MIRVRERNSTWILRNTYIRTFILKLTWSITVMTMSTKVIKIPIFLKSCIEANILGACHLTLLRQ